ncbi:MAG: PilZ domain-containing protein [Candidatus Hydrogenedentes bacterium]|nr:PilZ domain-containing protein [Candidatus Hydrogenedentota bacterium]
MNISDIEKYLSVGLSATIQAQNESVERPRYRTYLRGWQRGQYIMLDRPLINQRYVDMLRAEHCAVRFLSEGLACGFEGELLDLGPRSMVSHVYIAWPPDLSVIRVRKHERVRTSINCQIVVGDAEDRVPAEVRDVSEGGCLLLLPGRLPADSRVRIWCTFPDGTVMDGVVGLIRRIRPSDEGVFHGCRFDSPETDLHNDLQLFVADTLERSRTVNTPAPRILVIDPNPAVADAIRTQVETKGYQVVSSRNLVEAFYRLKVAYPSALLINQEQEMMPGVDICRAVRGTHGYQTLPVIIYGKDEGLREASKAAGATCYVSTANLIRQVAQLLHETARPAS